MEGFLFPMLVHILKRGICFVGLFSAHPEVKLWLVHRITVAAGT
jgi:hypothetical protein